MFISANNSSDDEASPPTCADQLHELAQTLPSFIEHTVLPLLSEEVTDSAADLGAQVDGTRQLLLQAAVLRRSSILAPMLKQQLVRNAAHVQRRRAQLVQVLQRRVKEWRATHPTASYKEPAASRTDASELRVLWHIVEAEMRGEERYAHLVEAPLCPPATAMNSFLTEAVTQRGLHLRVLAQVENISNSSSSYTTPSHGLSQAFTKKSGGPASPNQGTPTPQSSDEAGEAGDAIEEALHLLLRHARLHVGSAGAASPTGQRSKKRSTTQHSGGNNNSGSPSPRPASSSSPTLVGVTAANRGIGCDGVDEVVVDSESDEDDVEALLRLTAEEDLSAPPPGLTEASSQPTSHPSVSSPALWFVVPGIVSLRQYCADLPWVADVAEQRCAEARQRKKHSTSGGGEVGYFSRHVQSEDKDAKETTAAAATSRRQQHQQQQESSILSFATLGPLGCFFSPALAVEAAEGRGAGSPPTTTAAAVALSSSEGRTETMAARAVRHTESATAAGVAGYSLSSYESVRQADLPTTEGGGVPAGGMAPTDDRVTLARAVVQCVSPAVDEAWKDVEGAVVVPFCSTSTTHSAAAEASTTAALAEQKRGLEDAVSAFVEVMKVRYAVELAAQVVAARQAMELLLDSEDGVIFDGARLLSLSLSTPDAQAGTEQRQQQRQHRADTNLQGADTARGQRTTAAAFRSVLPCTVLTLPGLEEVFYVVAYCTGAAVLREVAAATHRFRKTEARRGGGHVDSDQPPVIDVDALDEDDGCAGAGLVAMDVINEEDTVEQRQTALQVWAVDFEQRFLAAPSAALSPLFRLWLYLWTFVLAVPPPSTTHGGRDEDHPPHQGQRARRQGNNNNTQLLVSLRTARRWMERVVTAALHRGCAESGVIRSATPSASPQTRLPSLWSSSEAEHVVRRTTAQARQALLRAAGVDGSV
jgi:hypothetical protein